MDSVVEHRLVRGLPHPGEPCVVQVSDDLSHAGVQREAAFQLLRVSLSTRGLEQSRAIMRTDHTLGELNADPNTYAEDLYFFTIMGEPSADEPWGWQLDGHHLIINFFVLGDQVVMTPVFMGAEPVITTSGKYAGNELLQVEQDRGLELMRSLSAEHRAEATISDFKQGRDIHFYVVLSSISC